MRTKRFGPGRALTIAGAILIVASLPMTWYHAERDVNAELTGWGIFTNLRIWLVVAAVLALATIVLERGRWTVLLRAGLGLLAGAPVLRRIISPPDASVPLDNRIGLYVALAGALAIIAGGLLSAGREAAAAMGWDVPGVGGTGRAALPPARATAAEPRFAREPEVVDAEIVDPPPRS